MPVHFSYKNIIEGMIVGKELYMTLDSEESYLIEKLELPETELPADHTFEDVLSCIFSKVRIAFNS